ncbi:MAG: nitroreductase family protein [Bacteroides sp.]|nr:nitroreductase family protein [Bacteroides sp.]
MTTFAELIKKRRSIRRFTEQEISKEHVEMILKAGLMSPTSKSSHSWSFLVVDDKEKLKALGMCKPHGATLIEKAPLAIVVMGDPLASQVWVEDASIAAIMMQLQAEDLGIGSCWVQVRERFAPNGITSDEYIHDLLNIPLQLQTLAVIAFGHKEGERPPHNEDELLWEKVHINSFDAER